MTSSRSRSLTVCFAILFIDALAFAATAHSPSSDGLCVWLDASDAASVTHTDGAATLWRDKSGHNRDAIAAGRPVRVDQAFNGKAAVRFSGKDAFTLKPLATAPGPLTVFVVSQRLEPQAGGTKW